MELDLNCSMLLDNSTVYHFKWGYLQEKLSRPLKAQLNNVCNLGEILGI